MSCGFGASLVIQRFTTSFKTLFFKSYGNQACLFGVVYNCFWGFNNFVDNRFPWVTKSFVNKSLSKLVKKCSRMGFFKLARYLKKSMACVNIIQW
jgi:hypothetical protein